MKRLFGLRLMLSVASLAALTSGCAIYVGSLPRDRSTSERPTTPDDTQGEIPGSPGVPIGPGSPVVHGAWTLLDVPALGDGAARAVAVGRDVWVVGTDVVLRVETSRDRVSEATAASSLAGATIVAGADGVLLGW